MLDDPHWATGVMRDRRPWSLGQMRKLGDSIRDETLTPEGCPSYSDVLVWYNDLAVAVQTYIADLEWDDLLVGRVPEITARAKTLDTLREKLQRMGDHPLQSIQDVAGVRFEAEMTLEEQDAVAGAIAGALEQKPSCIDDIREEPHCGYRAVHLRLTLPAGKVEVQIRTHLQGQWANMYEALGDLVGRGVRYGKLPDDIELAELVQDMQDRSTKGVVQIEEMLQQIADWHQLDALSPELTARVVDHESRVRELELDNVADMRRLTTTFRRLREGLE